MKMCLKSKKNNNMQKILKYKYYKHLKNIVILLKNNNNRSNIDCKVND